MTPRSGLVSLAIVGVLVGATGCSSSSDTGASSAVDSSSTPTKSQGSKPSKPQGSKTTPTAPADEPAVITIADFAFSGPDSVAPGTEVMVKNEDTTSHTLTAEGDGGFDVTIEGGATATFTAPSEPGSYPYICNFHGDMHGTLVVK